MRRKNRVIPTKPFSGADEAVLKRRSAPMAPIKKRGSIMWDAIISLIYHQSCRSYVAAARKQRALARKARGTDAPFTDGCLLLL